MPKINGSFWPQYKLPVQPIRIVKMEWSLRTKWTVQKKEEKGDDFWVQATSPLPLDYTIAIHERR
jgi:hypothetical protein